jgi:hypothetical protein
MGVAVRFTLLSSSRAWMDVLEDNLSVTNLVLSQFPLNYVWIINFASPQFLKTHSCW